MQSLWRNNFWRTYIVTSALLLLVLPVMAAAVVDYSKQTVTLTQTMQPISATSSVVMLVMHNPDRIPVNAIEAELFFDSVNIVVTNRQITSPLCEERFQLTHVLDQAAGRFFFQCGTTIPFSGTTTTVATIRISHQQALPFATFAYGTHTNILAHDGLGTPVARTVH